MLRRIQGVMVPPEQLLAVGRMFCDIIEHEESFKKEILDVALYSGANADCNIVIRPFDEKNLLIKIQNPLAVGAGNVDVRSTSGYIVSDNISFFYEVNVVSDIGGVACLEFRVSETETVFINRHEVFVMGQNSDLLYSVQKYSYVLSDYKPERDMV